MEFLLYNYFTKMLFVNPTCIINVARKSEFYEIILIKLKQLLEVNLTQKVRHMEC